MIEDTKLSSLESAEEILPSEHKHFPHYIPLAIVGLLCALGFLFYAISSQTKPQVAGTSTESTLIEGK